MSLQEKVLDFMEDHSVPQGDGQQNLSNPLILSLRARYNRETNHHHNTKTRNRMQHPIGKEEFLPEVTQLVDSQIYSVP